MEQPTGPATPPADDQPEPEDRPGDSVCWLRLVCPECGTMAESEPPTDCPQCGARIDPGR
jgi:rubrerythrin